MRCVNVGLGVYGSYIRVDFDMDMEYFGISKELYDFMHIFRVS